MRFDALAARRLEQVVAADDVGLQDRLPRPLDREAAEMDDAVDTLDGRLDLVDAGEVGGDEGLVGPEIGRLLDVAQPQLGIDALQQRRRRPPMSPVAPVNRTRFMVLSVVQFADSCARITLGNWRSSRR